MNLEDRLDRMQQTLEAFERRLATLEQRWAGPSVAAAPPPAPRAADNGSLQDEDVPAELLAVISATVAAYLGVKPRIRRIRIDRRLSWVQQGRVTIQASHALNVARD